MFHVATRSCDGIPPSSLMDFSASSSVRVQHEAYVHSKCSTEESRRFSMWKGRGVFFSFFGCPSVPFPLPDAKRAAFRSTIRHFRTGLERNLNYTGHRRPRKNSQKRKRNGETGKENLHQYWCAVELLEIFSSVREDEDEPTRSRG